ncbi:MAG: bifunctional alpha,alpha-trehalose-phosphate synthase (UDP-forming)/trehalose-phosphatase [Ferruginibacter sp.]
MGKTIIISNRLPVKISSSEDGYNFIPSEGGLATGLSTVYKNGHSTWIGWPGLFVDDEQQRKETGKKLAALHLYPVYLSNEEINQYYEGFSNEIIWPVFHYMATYARYESSYWDYYHAVNKKFCDALLKIYQPGDMIWVHDYHLLLLPKMIRSEFPDATIGFFQHIPFPSFEMFRLIPWRKELLEGLLGADLLGFHTYDDARHFLAACSRILLLQPTLNAITLQERRIEVASFPMGIDEKKFAGLTNEIEVRRHIESLQQTFHHTKLVLTIDRLDYSKGILQRLQAFDLFLEKFPAWREKVSLYMIVVPSRDSVPMYKELRNEIDKLAGNINARYRTHTWTPINYFYRSYPVEMLSALYQFADVCLVTPMRDGMNLVCKEFIASRQHNDGVLILSEMAGAAKELVDSIIVNPNNITEISYAILTALDMPLQEQQRRMKSMRALVSKFNVHHWVNSFMQDLQEVKQTRKLQESKYISFFTTQLLRNRYVRAKRRLILLDYDGTLVNFTTEIDAAAPDETLYQILGNLLSDRKNKVVIISGRPHHTLEKWFGHLPIDLVAEHGVMQKKNGTEWETTIKADTAWKQKLLPILQVYTERTPGSFTEEKTHSLAWHYRGAENDLGNFRANELMGNLRYLVADLPLVLLNGNKIIEIKSSETNKGKAAQQYTSNKQYQFIMAMGDDTTDEDMFKAVKETGYTIKVGTHHSAAAYCFDDVAEARDFLDNLPAKMLLSKMLDALIHIVPYPPFSK